MGYLTSLSFEERFFRNVNKESEIFPDSSDPLVSLKVIGTNCWVWTGGYNSNGYPRYNCKKPGMGTIPYRISWKILVGEIQHTLDHLCRNPGCVRPSHLEDVPMRVNVLRGGNPFAVNARKTHCINGHEFTKENTLVKKDGRRCRECAKVKSRKWHRANRQKKREGEQHGNHQHS